MKTTLVWFLFDSRRSYTPCCSESLTFIHAKLLNYTAVVSVIAVKNLFVPLDIQEIYPHFASDLAQQIR